MQGTILSMIKCILCIRLFFFFCSYSNILQWSLFEDYFATLEIPY